MYCTLPCNVLTLYYYFVISLHYVTNVISYVIYFLTYHLVSTYCLCKLQLFFQTKQTPNCDPPHPAAGPSIGGSIAESIGFPWLMTIIGIIDIFFAPLCIFLRNPPGQEEKIVRFETHSNTFDPILYKHTNIEAFGGKVRRFLISFRGAD